MSFFCPSYIIYTILHVLTTTKINDLPEDSKQNVAMWKTPISTFTNFLLYDSLVEFEIYIYIYKI